MPDLPAVAATTGWYHKFVLAPTPLQIAVYFALALFAYAMPVQTTAGLAGFAVMVFMIYKRATEQQNWFNWTLYGFKAVPYDPVDAPIQHELSRRRYFALQLYLALVLAVVIGDAYTTPYERVRHTKLYKVIGAGERILGDAKRISSSVDRLFCKYMKKDADIMADVVVAAPNYAICVCTRCGLFVYHVSKEVIDVLAPHAEGVIDVFCALPKRLGLVGRGNVSAHVGPRYVHITEIDGWNPSAPTVETESDRTVLEITRAEPVVNVSKTCVVETQAEFETTTKAAPEAPADEGDYEECLEGEECEEEDDSTAS